MTSATQNAHWQKGDQLPVTGLLLQAPVVTNSPYAVDLPLQFANATRIRITVDVTQEQLDNPLSTDGIFYCSGDKDIGDFVSGYMFDSTRMVPDIIGVGFSVEEVINPFFPLLYIGSRNDRTCDVRVRAI